jgi:hypothetical protein
MGDIVNFKPRAKAAPHLLAIAPRLGVTGEKLERIAAMVAVDTAAMSQALETSRAAVLTAMLTVCAGMAAEIDKAKAADFIDALTYSLRPLGPCGADLAKRRIDGAAAAFYAADQARA